MESKFSAKEAEILKFWQDNKIFEKSLKKASPKGDYVFYDGPPFATGTPHYGHIPSSLLKDVVPRFWTMNGFHVARRWGWDCHGLPVENLIEKELKIKTKKDIEEKIGVCGFNDACRKSVMKYADVWKKFIPRMGRFVDMENDYKTMDVSYMESIWWVFKTLFDRGLIYQGYKSMHICPRCETTLSNFEVTQNYKDITDLSVIAKFKIKKTRKQKNKKTIDLSDDTYVLAWTTTPWTLPGNVALAMGERINYVKVESEGAKYILAKDNLEQIFEGKKYKEIGMVKVKDLEGIKYEPLFDYFVQENLENKSAGGGPAFGWENIYTIQTADFVTVEDGTGVVHIAPGFGEDDMNLGKEKKLPTILHVTPEGRFSSEVKDWAGELVKPVDDVKRTDRKIVDYLTKKDLVFKTEEFTHSYPFCWRCDTPLLNYATTSWFVEVTAVKDKLIKNNKKINWVPQHLKAGRFGKWLEGAEDWAISRQRYWGAPLPVWKCECGEIKVVGSIEELDKLSGQKVNDLHKHIVDEITFKCKKCDKVMKRVPEVLDCWFESGSMPYAQAHYPFENKDWFENNFPAEFIAEGVDQTRGWFYTLMVLSTALFNKPAFNNVIVHGIVLAEDGTKMSKHLKNYPEPDLVIEQYGADALRYYLLTSPVMEAESLNFSENGVKEALQKVIILVSNVLSFYLIYCQPSTVNRQPSRLTVNGKRLTNILDRWILAKLNLLNQEVTAQMKNYDVIKASRPLGEFINELSTWYLRRSRERFKAGDEAGINTLGFVLQEFAKLAAPFTPFVAEEIYQKVGGGKESVHLENWPKVYKKLIDKKLLEEMDLARQIVEKGLAARAAANIRVRQALNSHTTALTNKLDKELVDLVKDELNIKELKFGVQDELDIKITEELKQAGLVREIIRQINQLRKESGLTINDKVVVYQEGLDEVFDKFGRDIKKATIAEKIESGSVDKMKEVGRGGVGIKKIN